MVAGLLALAVIFAATLPLVAARLALAVQFQVSRIFWMFDLTLTIYLVWALAGGWRWKIGANAATPATRAAVLAAILVCAACGRGLYVSFVEHPGRALVQYGLPRTDWHDAMAWLRATPAGAHVLADPAHAWRQGTSVRVAAGRDVYFEEVKDTAMAMYSRRVAVRAAERIQALGDFGGLTPESARRLASRFDLDFLVTSAAMDLPIAYRNPGFVIYRLRP
jgi:hypothetical protein